MGTDGATWANQPQAVKDLFVSAYGAEVEAQWDATTEPCSAGASAQEE